MALPRAGRKLAAVTSSSPRFEIALVDDDLSVRRALSRLLRAEGFGVRVFATAQELLDGELGPLVCCLVADVHLGAGLSGFEAAERLLAGGRSLPLIFITAHDDPASRERARRLGAKAFLRKPFEASTLMDVVRGVVPEAV
jgi:FixJ family two-component response regulator